MPALRKSADPTRWLRFAESRVDLFRRNRADDALDRVLAALGPVEIEASERILIGDGMWFNPNHFFRLRLFVQALVDRGECLRLVGVLRRSSDARARRALERIGFSQFVYIDDDEFRTEQFLGEAERLLAGIRSHEDLLALALPESLPAYTFYDTVLKLATHPQPPIDHPLWLTVLAEVLRNAAIYGRELATRKVAHVALSHPWKSEWATLAWLALGRGIPVYHLTGFCQAIRIRRFRLRDDYATPVEHVTRAAFDNLPAPIRERIAAMGTLDLTKRASGASTDINVRHAFDPVTRIADRHTARLALSGQSERPVAIIYGHVWYDFPHTFAMKNFSDFLDWTNTTLARIRDIDDVIWLLKPHPTELWYGRFHLSSVAGDLPLHVRLLPLETDCETALVAADAVITVHGTVALEAAARGIPVILADRSYFSDWGIAHAARDRNEYLQLLGKVAHLASPDAAARERASACFALALAEPPANVSALRLMCDSSGTVLYDAVRGCYERNGACIAREVQRIRAFLDQAEIDSYAAFHLIESAWSGDTGVEHPGVAGSSTFASAGRDAPSTSVTSRALPEPAGSSKELS